MAPEIKILKKEDYIYEGIPIDGCKADIYSTGISMLYLNCPKDNKNSKKLLKKFETMKQQENI